jgi:tetratricopeptide (TPR) repeat protein
MSNSTVIRRKDMREPDRFQVVANQAASWLAARKKQTALVGGAAALVVVAVGVVAAVQASRAEAAGKAASELLVTVGAPVIANPEAGSPQKSFPTDDAKQRAIIAEADKILAAYGSTRSADLAVLAKGDALYVLKEWDKAAAEYERYLKDAPRDDSLRFGALDGLGLVAEAKGDLPGAAKAYERMGQEASRFADRADLERARVLAAAGKVDEARQILSKFAESHKESSLNSQATQQLGQLGAK